MKRVSQSRLFPLPLVLGVALMLPACGGGDSGDTGRVSLAVTDAPVDIATAVVVRFDGVQLKRRNGGLVTFGFSSPRRIDLLDLQGDVSQPLLDGETVPAGEYAWIRLQVAAGEEASSGSRIELEDGSVHPLFIPSGSRSGLKLVSGFTVPTGGEADLTVDFDLRKSVHEPDGSTQGYVLRPALRLVDSTEVGHIAGTVGQATASDPACSSAVYVYQGGDVPPDDVGSGTPPLTSAMARLNESTGDYRYEAGFLPPGDYTVSWTCKADDDRPDTNDAVEFVDSRNATVKTGETTTVDF